MIRAKHLFVVGAALTLAAAAAAAVLQDSFSLRKLPAKDSAYKYQNTLQATVMGTEAKANFTQTLTITEVKDDTYSVEAGAAKGSLDVGGMEMEMPEMTATTVYGQDGVARKLEGEMAGPEMYRGLAVSTVFRPEAPVKVGDTWTWSAAADSEKGTMKTEGTYKLVAIEEVAGEQAAKIEMDVKEVEGGLPASAKGIVWLSLASGMELKSEAEFKNLPLPGAPEPLSGKRTSIIVK